MRYLNLLLFLACAIFGVCKMADAQTRRTVRDYYLRMPSSYFLESPSENLRKRPIVVDVANDYIETFGEKGQPYLTTALFRYKGAELFAVYAQLEKGDVLKFYRLSDEKLRDVTKQVWQIKSRPHDRIYLPRRGTTIVIMDETYPGDEKTRLTVKWRNGRFVK